MQLALGDSEIRLIKVIGGLIPAKLAVSSPFPNDRMEETQCEKEWLPVLLCPARLIEFKVLLVGKD